MPTTLPTRHLSIRVPWHDAGWDGTICRDPLANGACLKLANIAEKRNDLLEANLAGRRIDLLNKGEYPPCVNDRGTFMAPFEITRVHRHPYSEFSKQHSHFAPTEVTYGPYTASCVPFRWVAVKSVNGLRDLYGLHVDDAFEPDLGFPSGWVQDVRNHEELLGCFWDHIKPVTSLCFFYAKQVPFLDDSVRALVGVGRVMKVGEAVEYDYNSNGSLRSLVWERSVKHSIRPDCKDGFLLPYHAAIAAGLDPASMAALVPADRADEFMYASELVTHDGAIASLLGIAEALKSAEQVLAGQWGSSLQWVNDRLAEIWRMRGPFPGLGSSLAAVGLPMATFVAREVERQVGENENVWPLVDAMFADPQRHLPTDLASHIGGILQKSYLKLPPERKDLLRLLSRYQLSADQCSTLFNQERRQEEGIQLTDEAILADPYVIPEATRSTTSPVDVYTIDRGTFPPEHIALKNPVPEPTKMDGGTDPRRVRALVVEALEQGASKGHTLLPRNEVVQGVRELNLDPPCALTGDMAAVAEETFSTSISIVSMSDKSAAYQLSRLTRVGAVIRDKVTKRRGAARLSTDADWTQLLDEHLGGSASDELELRAREEKIAALEELAKSRFSVLLGPAGTGKTTLLTALCSHQQVIEGGVLLLAPTGKARVRMKQAAKGAHFSAHTIAQFLSGFGRFEGKTQTYSLSSKPPYKGAKTVIVDEASMLTEEMLGALLDALTGVDRLILVGDPQQLPPIGAGRPFVDIVASLRPDDADAIFPRVGPCYAELTIKRRQTGDERIDLQIAEWFSGRPLGAGDDDVFDQAAKASASKHIDFRRWDSTADLNVALNEILSAELKLAGDDLNVLDLSLGATETPYGLFFNRGAAAHAEDWQILTPVRQMGYGVETLNRQIHRQFRHHWVEKARRWKDRKIPKPFGPQELVYGDKVICTSNHFRGNESKNPRVYPVEGCECYLANGEIGIAVGQYKTKNFKHDPWQLEVEFATQLGHSYKFVQGEFEGDESVPRLELAYALTIHKSQGSEFGLVVVVLPNPCRLLSRELIYTALTRQRDRIVVLHQGSFAEFKKFGTYVFSETARRITNLFNAPTMIEIGGAFLEERLIHRTCDGVPVRSKSEVIIYDHLHARGLKPLYEQTLTLGGTIRYPDFTVENDDAGVTYYWEHCGMMGDPAYRQRWERKKQWYIDNGVAPLENGGGPAGTLIVTEDDDHGGISSKAIVELISRIFG